jgi:isoquinoline 1-oxidoreductase alpha subunit
VSLCGGENVRYTITVNGQKRPIEADGDMPLLWVLRDLLGMTGTKFGCGAGLCGACTVLMDGKATRSCMLPIARIGAAKISTIESLSRDRSHPLQKAWLEEQVPQCGYCQSGMLMAAAALLAEKSKPTDEEIAAAMTNLCRCGTYNRVRRAIKRAAGMPA